MSSPERVFNVLFLCTGNSARSILAESMLNAVGGPRFRAYSAGSRPAGRVNPFALEFLRRNGMPTAGLRSKGWDEFAREAAPHIDFVITVCDNAAGEVCPIWPGKPTTAHWSVPDPAGIEGSAADRRQAFADVAHVLLNRIRAFASLRLDSLDQRALAYELRAIGHVR